MNIWIFIISVIVVTVLLFSINYQYIYDYVTYTVPMKNASFERDVGHYDYIPLNSTKGMMSMEKILLMDNEKILVKFNQNNYQLYSSGYKPIPVFDYIATFQKGDTFAILCSNIGKDGYVDMTTDLDRPWLPGLGIVKYLGLYHVEDIIVFLFWHTSATVEVDMPCDYPEIIRHSINLWEIQEMGKPDAPKDILESYQ